MTQLSLLSSRTSRTVSAPLNATYSRSGKKRLQVMRSWPLSHNLWPISHASAPSRKWEGAYKYVTKMHFIGIALLTGNCVESCN